MHCPPPIFIFLNSKKALFPLQIIYLCGNKIFNSGFIPILQMFTIALYILYLIFTIFYTYNK